MSYKIVKGDEYLSHHGILGQKWGIRRYQNEDGSLTSAGKTRYRRDHSVKDPDGTVLYDNKQYSRDRSIYSPGGASRIRKNITKGDSVSGARSREASRINRARNQAVIGETIGSTIGSIAGYTSGAIAGALLGDYYTKRYGEIFGGTMGVITASAVALGARKVGKQLGGKIGSSSVMAAYGYDPAKYR